MNRSTRLQQVRRLLWDYLLITVGAIIVAVGLNAFLAPNQVVSTGVTGLGMLAHYLWGLPIGIVTLVINVPLFIIGVKWGGGARLGLRTLYATIVMSLGYDLLARVVPPVSGDPLLYTLFGGICDGVGLGLVFRGHGTCGGTDIVARVLNRWKGWQYGEIMLYVNSAILLLGVSVVGLTPILYALIVNFISSRMVDVVLEGQSYGRSVLIVSGQPDRIREAVLTELERGVTVLEGRGGYTDDPREVLFCVVRRSELAQLKRLVSETDPEAFVVISEAHEVLGEGFRPVAAH